MLFKNIAVLDENYQIKENMYVSTAGERIAYIGSEKPRGDFGYEYDGKGKLLMPGFPCPFAHGADAWLR